MTVGGQWPRDDGGRRQAQDPDGRLPGEGGDGGPRGWAAVMLRCEVLQPGQRGLAWATPDFQKQQKRPAAATRRRYAAGSGLRETAAI